MGEIAENERGSASVEHAALVLLMALIALAVIALLAIGPGGGGGSLASTVVFKQRCAVRYPDPCWQDPLSAAYGRGLAGAVRALAPAPETKIGPDGAGLVGVDYRRCRRASCATPLPGAAGLHLTASNRRTVAFTAVEEGAAAGGAIAIDYWLYRPTIGWERVRRYVGASELAGYRGIPLLDSADPVLIPLETTLGRDDARFAPTEEPPWRGKVASRWGQ